MSIFALLFQDAGSGFNILAFLPFILIFGIFYFLVIMPQKKKQAELNTMITELKINDEVVTNGGIIGRIKEVRDTSFIVQSAEKSFLEVAKTSVIGRKPVDEK